MASASGWRWGSGSRFIAVSAFAFFLTAVQAAPPGTKEPSKPMPEPIDGGRTWQRDIDHAHTEARRQNKPLLVLAGNLERPVSGVLRASNIFPHPLIAEVAESLFIPVALSPNLADPTSRSANKHTREASTRASIRFLDAKGTDLVPTIHGRFTDQLMVVPMIKALRESNVKRPEYLLLTREEAMCRARGVRRATLGMHCFWDGELVLGQISGVVETTPGFIGNIEVVDIKYDRHRTSFEDIVKTALAQKVADSVYTNDTTQMGIARKIVGDAVLPLATEIKPDDDPKHHLGLTPLKFLPMTSLQSIRINAALAAKAEYRQMLSPRQLLMLDAIERDPKAEWPIAIGQDIRKVWFRTLAVVRSLEPT